ncbi:MAG: helix-turn-helix domain-containing protein [Pyrinomonadaceae bacterium]
MSRGERQTKESIEFIERLTDACGSARAADIKRLLGITYQTAKNYLNGRLPHPEILIKISEETGCSIDWLLTGRGNKMVRPYDPARMPSTPAELRMFVESVFEDVVTDIGEERQKTYVLRPDNLVSEKVLENSNTLSEKSEIWEHRDSKSGK